MTLDLSGEQAITAIVVAGVGALALVPKMLKESSEAFTGFLSHSAAKRKERMELFEALDALANANPSPRPTALEAKSTAPVFHWTPNWG